MKSLQLISAVLACGALAYAQTRPRDNKPQVPTEPFKGVTTDGNILPGLFAIRSTGVTTEHPHIAERPGTR